MMGIVVPETCWAYKKYNKIISNIYLVLILQLFVWIFVALETSFHIDGIFYLKLLPCSECCMLSSGYEGWTGCSETSAYKIQTPRNYPEESIQHRRYLFSVGHWTTAKNVLVFCILSKWLYLLNMHYAIIVNRVWFVECWVWHMISVRGLCVHLKSGRRELRGECNRQSEEILWNALELRNHGWRIRSESKLLNPCYVEWDRTCALRRLSFVLWSVCDTGCQNMRCLSFSPFPVNAFTT